MSKPPKNVLSLPLNDRALMALRSAVKEAIAEQHAKGLPVYIWRNGRVVALPPPKKRGKAKRARKPAAAANGAHAKARGAAARRGRRSTA